MLPETRPTIMNKITLLRGKTTVFFFFKPKEKESLKIKNEKGNKRKCLKVHRQRVIYTDQDMAQVMD